MSKSISLSEVILVLMFMLLPVDMLNGILLHNNINLPLSLGQLHKFLILALLFLSFLFNLRALFFSITCIAILFLPSLFQAVFQLKLNFLFGDLIKISRYLMPLFSVLFFVKLIRTTNKRNIELLFKLVRFSYVFFVFNILIKYLGFGYPMYIHGDVGSKGFFYAGNETSVVLIVLGSILGFKIWQNESKFKYLLFFLFNLFVGLTISSKTGTIGVILTFILIPMSLPKAKINIKRLSYLLLSIFIFIPVLLAVVWEFLVNSPVFLRLKWFWNELDIITFIFSNRNNFFVDGLNVYIEKYNFIEKVFGVGQTRYEALNGNSIVEIDSVDIFFAYGLVGLVLFIFLIAVLWVQALRFKRSNNYSFSGLVSLMIVVLLGISTIAGHVFSSGMAAIFIGLLFSLMYIKNDAIGN
jgi:hypothetical protein